MKSSKRGLFYERLFYNKKEGGDDMKDKMFSIWRNDQVIDMIYMDGKGKISKRRIRIINIHDQKFVAYCYLRNAKRTFQYENILSFVPIIKRETTVI